MAIKTKKNIFRKLYRNLKLQYIKLLRSNDGGKKVAIGATVGFCLQLLVLPSICIIYLLFYPLVKLFKGSLSSAVIGHIIAKIIWIEVLLLPLGYKLGKFLIHGHTHNFHKTIAWYLNTLLGMSIITIIISVPIYYIIFYLYNANKRLRVLKKKNRKTIS